MYKIVESSFSGDKSLVIPAKTMVIPFDPANTDYQTFKDEVSSGKAELQDADGVTMTHDAAVAFIKTLP